MRRALIVAIFVATVAPAGAAPAAEVSTDIGYPTVAAARQALRNEPILSYSIHQGEETIIVGGPLLKETRTFWRFGSEDHRPYPIASRFDFIREGDGFTLRESLLCDGEKAACLAIHAETRKDAENWRRHILAPKAFKY